MNEATFEARAQKAIKEIFPSYANLELTHQLIFSVNLGHKVIDVKPSVKKPRLDILIKQEEKNLAVLELKRPGHSLRDEDRDQGVSYARLLTPMPPLVIVSNGKETRFYETTSGEPFNTLNSDAEELKKLFVRALEIAASQKDQAVRILLGKDPLIWEKVIGDLNRISFQDHLGSVETLSQPIAKSFNLPREATEQIVDLVSGNNPVIAVTGAPLVGKTNVLYELCQLKGFHLSQFILMQKIVNPVSCSIWLITLPNIFSINSIDDVRYWLQHGIVNNPHPAGKIVIIIDDVCYSDDHLIREINELIELCSCTRSCSLVIACDSSNYHLMTHVPGRPKKKTLFGKRALKVEVNNLSDVEFDMAKEYIKKHWSADFHQGAQYSRELRTPRLLRMIISNFPRELNIETRLLIPSFLPFRALNWVLSGFSSDRKFIGDMVKLVKAFIEEDNQDVPSPIIGEMVSYGRGHVLYDKAENLLGETRIDRLLQQGHIDWFTDKEQNQYIVPKVPELLAASAVEALISKASGMKFKEAIDYVLKQSERLPYGDLIGANVFERLIRERHFPLYELIVYLINKPPKIEKVLENFNGAVYFDQTGLVAIPRQMLDTSEEIRMFSNLFPWLVLSQLVTELMRVEDSEDPWEVYREILIVVGGYQNVLRRFEPATTPEDIMGYKTHALRSKDGKKGRYYVVR